MAGSGSVEPVSDQDKAKWAAGVTAIRTYLRDGMKVGLGSGTTSHWFVRALAGPVRDGLDVVGAATSSTTLRIAKEVGVPIADLDELGELDITIDGADEIDRHGTMIKGGGACLLWEKIVAAASARMVAIVDDTKLKERLGRFPLPVEVIPFGARSTERHLRRLLAEFGYEDLRITLRRRGGEPLVTDSGHWILDVELEEIRDAHALSPRFNLIPGVVEHGLFTGIASEIVIGHPDGTAEVRAVEPV